MYVVLALLLLGVLIIAHEGGHFWAARACGIGVQEFSMGMGPLIAKWQSKKGTQFSVRLLPIGGYCQFYGEDEEKNDPRAFNNQPVWKRAITVFSGPLMNFVIAFLAIALFMSAIGVNTVVTKVAQVEETAQAAGLQIGDEITAVNGETVATSDAIAKAISASGGEAVTLTVKRDGRTLDLTLTPFYDAQAGRYRGGFSFGQERVRVSVFESIPFSLQYNVGSVRLIMSTLKNLVFKGQGVVDVTGPDQRHPRRDEPAPDSGAGRQPSAVPAGRGDSPQAGQAGAGGRDSRGGLHSADGADGAADVQGHHAFLCEGIAAGGRLSR